MEKRRGRPLHTQPPTPPEFRNSGAQTVPHEPRVLNSSQEIVQTEVNPNIYLLF